MSQFPLRHVCPRRPFPNAVWPPAEHQAAQDIHKHSHLSRLTILKGRHSYKGGHCKERRGGGNGVFPTTLQVSFTLLTFCTKVSLPLAEWHGAGHLTLSFLTWKMGAPTLQQPRSCGEDHGNCLHTVLLAGCLAHYKHPIITDPVTGSSCRGSFEQGRPSPAKGSFLFWPENEEAGAQL